ncbi:hypothetical protein K432DRAFT_409329 [Lepidopterella palustris CBS 459.81]|uniref:Uncharacterized protein n=1 Tax=Lepidopterella palustris CBS 459.81 TaxID=1314670 RepID=A0A8E2E0L5_9PEZI|nr:hypothetical protein K432DRAFT_409329 [Lepidopterella palustris CBS 459.81]
MLQLNICKERKHCGSIDRHVMAARHEESHFLQRDILNPSPLISKKALNAAIKESLRLHPPFPSSFSRTVALGVENAIPGFQPGPPIGTKVSVNLYVLALSTEIWGKDAAE